MPPPMSLFDSIRAHRPNAPKRVKRQPSTARVPVPPRTKEAWTFSLLVGVAGGLVGAFYGGLIGSAQRSAPLSLRPYLDPGWTNAAVGWMQPRVQSPIFASLVLAAGAAGWVLFCDAVIRRAFLAPRPGAAALATTAVLAAAAFGAALKLEGHWGIVAGFALAPIGGVLVLDGRGSAVW